MPNTPIDTDPINTWMLANGWEWQDSGMKGVEGWWRKPNMDTVSQDLAAEMYRMSEVREAIGEDEARPKEGPKRNGIDQGLRRTRNKLRAELRERLNLIPVEEDHKP